MIMTIKRLLAIAFLGFLHLPTLSMAQCIETKQVSCDSVFRVCNVDAETGVEECGHCKGIVSYDSESCIRQIFLFLQQITKYVHHN